MREARDGMGVIRNWRRGGDDVAGSCDWRRSRAIEGRGRGGGRGRRGRGWSGGRGRRQEDMGR